MLLISFFFSFLSLLLQGLSVAGPRWDYASSAKPWLGEWPRPNARSSLPSCRRGSTSPDLGEASLTTMARPSLARSGKPCWWLREAWARPAWLARPSLTGGWVSLRWDHRILPDWSPATSGGWRRKERLEEREERREKRKWVGLILKLFLGIKNQPFFTSQFCSNSGNKIFCRK